MYYWECDYCGVKLWADTRDELWTRRYLHIANLCPIMGSYDRVNEMVKLRVWWGQG